MKVTATKVIARALQPGDLFSTVGPEYWDRISINRSVGERVYIRTESPAQDFSDADYEVYRIEIQREESTLTRVLETVDAMDGALLRASRRAEMGTAANVRVVADLGRSLAKAFRFTSHCIPDDAQLARVLADVREGGE